MRLCSFVAAGFRMSSYGCFILYSFRSKNLFFSYKSSWASLLVHVYTMFGTVCSVTSLVTKEES